MDSLLLKNGRNHVSKKIDTEFFHKTFRDFPWKAVIEIYRANKKLVGISKLKILSPVEYATPFIFVTVK